MHGIALEVLFFTLMGLVLLSAFFSGSETGMMSINRYRLRHMVRKNNRTAKRVSKLLKRPDRLLGVVLIGNTFANVLASAVMTIIAARLYGDVGVAFATIILTLIILIFAEVVPKTFASLHPFSFSFAVSLPLQILLTALYPLVWFANMIANGVLRGIGIKVRRQELETLTREELKTIVKEASGKISMAYQDMLVSILELGEAKVDHIMIPRHEIIGINLDDNWHSILDQLRTSQHTRLPVYRDNIDQVQGVLHVRTALNLLVHDRLNKNSLMENMEEVYIVPEGTPLNVQLTNFKQEKCRIGFVVNEYGDIQGLVTLEDILEEIVGQFTTDIVAASKHLHHQKDGSFLVDGRMSVREVNRTLKIKLPVEGPSTLSGLIVEKLENLPKTSVSLRIGDYTIEVVEVKHNKVKLARIWP